jgi:hypothetical protein
MEKFIGPRKIELIAETEFKTHGGKDVVKVMYDGGFSEIMPKSECEFLQEDKATDYNQLRKKKMGRILEEVLTVIAEHDLKAADIEALKAGIENELYNSFNRATHFLWTKDDKSFIPGNNVVLERSLLEADLVLKTINKKDESTGEGKTSEKSA